MYVALERVYHHGHIQWLWQKGSAVKAKYYKKFKRWHQSAHESILIQAVKIEVQPFRRWAVLWSYWHKQKSLENSVKWYHKAFEGTTGSADVNSIRSNWNYPEFDPKRSQEQEPDSTVSFWRQEVGVRTIHKLNPESVDDGIN